MSGLSRREFFLQSGLYGGSLWMLLNMPRPRAVRAAQESTLREVLDEGQWKTVEAMTGRIIPTDHEPGAIEAGEMLDLIPERRDRGCRADQPIHRMGHASMRPGQVWPGGPGLAQPGPPSSRNRLIFSL